jgi:hypothetical protein
VENKGGVAAVQLTTVTHHFKHLFIAQTNSKLSTYESASFVKSCGQIWGFSSLLDEVGGL